MGDVATPDTEIPSYGDWVVIGPAPKTERNVRWMVRCGCGAERPIRAEALRRGKSRSCVQCAGKRKRKGDTAFYNHFKANAVVRGLTWRLTVPQFRRKFDVQEGRCALTGVELVWPVPYSRETRSSVTASLDRIRSDRGYTWGNVQWVHKRVNLMKGAMSDEELREWARRIVAYSEVKEEP